MAALPGGSVAADLPGLVPNPKPLDGYGGWQIETALPRRSISAAAVTPDLRRIALAPGTGTIPVLDTTTLQLENILVGHTEPLMRLLWSPDGAWLASIAIVNVDEGVRLWKADGTAGPVFHPDDRTTRPLTIAWKPDGTALVSSAGNGRLEVWNVDGTAGPKWNASSFEQVAWSSQDLIAADVNDVNDIHVWTLDGTRVSTLKGHTDRVSALSFSPDGKTLASGSYDKTVRLWSADGKPIAVLQGHTGNLVRQVGWSPDGRYLASCGDNDMTVRIWSSDGQTGPVFEHGGGESVVFGFTWAPDGQRLVSWTYTTLHEWGINGRHVGSSVYRRWATSVDSSRVGDLVAMASSDGSVGVWQIDGTPVGVIKAGQKQVRRVIWSPTGKHLATLGDDEIVRLWTSQGKSVAMLRPTNGEFAWSPDGQYIAGGSGLNTLKIWALNGRQQAELLPLHSTRSVEWNPQGDVVAVIGSNEPPTLWSVRNERRQLTGHAQPASSIAWSPDGKWLATGGNDRTVRFWKPDGTPGPVFQAPGEVHYVRWTADGEWVAAECHGYGVHLCKPDGTEGPVISKQGQYHFYSGYGLCSPTEQLLAISGNLGGAEILGGMEIVGVDGSIVSQIRSPDREFHSVSWSADGSRVVLGSVSNSILVCDPHTGEPQWTGLLLRDGSQATFANGGKLLHGDQAAIERELRYIVQPIVGPAKVLKSSEFHELLKNENLTLD